VWLEPVGTQNLGDRGARHFELPGQQARRPPTPARGRRRERGLNYLSTVSAGTA
jgi:hypothetical protein